MILIMNPNAEISHAFNAHASEYEAAAKVQYEIGERLFDRLEYLKINPRYILDLGCGPGVFLQRLKTRYPKATVIGLDIAIAMLNMAKKKSSWRKKNILVQGDMTNLPFKSGMFDLIFANQVIHWSIKLDFVFQELNRILSPTGCLMFSTLGPDTFLELRQAFSKADSYAHVNDFLDMHDVGDCLLRCKFADPVVDMERLTAHFSSFEQLLHSLKAQGVRNMHVKRNPGLTGRNSWIKFKQQMLEITTDTGKVPLTYEVVYGHAWKGVIPNATKGFETFIPISEIKRKI